MTWITEGPQWGHHLNPIVPLGSDSIFRKLPVETIWNFKSLELYSQFRYWGVEFSPIWNGNRNITLNCTQMDRLERMNVFLVFNSFPLECFEGLKWNFSTFSFGHFQHDSGREHGVHLNCMDNCCLTTFRMENHFEELYKRAVRL